MTNKRERERENLHKRTVFTVNEENENDCLRRNNNNSKISFDCDVVHDIHDSRLYQWFTCHALWFQRRSKHL